MDCRVKSSMAMKLKQIHFCKLLMAATVPCLASGIGALAQNKYLGVAGTAAQAADAKEWPTYGHDSGGMRFSPLTQINPANVGNLQVAWVYHMKQAGDTLAARRGPAAPAGQTAPGAGNGNPGGGGAPGAGGGDQVAAQAAQEGIFQRESTGFSYSEVTPLVIQGVMYIGTPYGRV